MDYERIGKPFSQGGGFSPGKLRAMLLGVEKKRKEEEEPETLDGQRVGPPETCRDVECSTLVDLPSGHRSRDQHHLVGARMGRNQEEDSFDSESVASSAFEFHKVERGPHQRPPALMSPFSKPAPSKWDDAQKWIASPTSSRQGKGSGGGAVAAQQRKLGMVGGGGRQMGAKVVVEIAEYAVDTKRIDPSQGKTEEGMQRTANWLPEMSSMAESVAKPAKIFENPVADSAVNLSRHDSSTSAQIATTFVTPPSTVTSVSMRDVGTEMTPVASQEPSRTTTPVRATTPSHSPASSQPSTPIRTSPNSAPFGSAVAYGNSNSTDMSEKELQMKTRREIMILGTQLGKTNIAAWASKEEEETDASASLKTVSVDQPSRSVIEIRAAAWEEAEKAKYLARFKREEIKILAWENHQKAKIEAEMRKIEVDVEKMRARAHDRLMNKLAAARHKAEGKRAAAEAKRNQQAAKTAQQAEYIRRTGRIPSSFSCWGWCS